MQRLLWIVCVIGFGGFITGAVAVPPEFIHETIDSGTAFTDFAWTPDGRMLIIDTFGTIDVYTNGAVLPMPALQLGTKVCTNIERGLLGITVHPEFASNNYIYVYYTFNKFNDPAFQCATKTGPDALNTPVNRVSRFSLPPSNIIDPDSEQVIIDNIPAPDGTHNGGDLLFGKDGYLYVSIGDGGHDYTTGAGYSGSGGANDAARDPHVLLGRILRVTDTGAIPADNPFTGPNTEPCADDGFATPGNFCQETWAWGLRNPFRIALDPNSDTTRIFIHDVGQNEREEINEGLAGADYGWNCREGTLVNSTVGACNPTPPNMVDPVYEYQHDQCTAVSGGTFIPNGIWPAEYTDAYLFSDYVCGQTFVLKQTNSSWNATVWTDDIELPISLGFGPYEHGQALYYAQHGADGRIGRIRYIGTDNQTPIAMLDAAPVRGAVPLQVSFDASQSSDPEQGALLYRWDFGDGSEPISTTEGLVTYTYLKVGTFEATLVVQDAIGQLSTPLVQQIEVEPLIFLPFVYR